MTTTTPSLHPLPLQWRVALPVVFAMIALLIAVYWETASAIVVVWMQSGTFTHGFLVPPIVGWLVWRQRTQLAKMVPTPNYWALLLLAAAVFGWLLGDLAAVNAVMQLGFVAMLVLLVPALLGFAVARALIFPLAFLFFAVPIGEFAMPQLMVWTADFTVAALRLTGIPVYREGLQFVIPSGNWSVVEACSGVRYLIASVTVGTLFAYLNYQSTSRRLLFVGVSILVPVLANWLRAYMIVMLGHFSSNKLATGVDHLVYGWLFFGVVIMLMFMIGARWSEPELVVNDPVGTSANGSRSSSSKPRFWAAALCFAVLVCLPHLRLLMVAAPAGAAVIEIKTLQASGPAWQTVAAEQLDLKPAFQNPSAQSSSLVASAGKQVGLYLGFYKEQNLSRKLVSSNNVLVVSSDAKWTEAKTSQSTAVIGGQHHTVKTSELRGQAGSSLTSDTRLEAWQIYWISGTLTSNDYAAKVYSAFYRLLGQGDDSAVIVVYTKKETGSDSKVVLQSFLDAHYAQIDANLSALRRQK